MTAAAALSSNRCQPLTLGVHEHMCTQWRSWKEEALFRRKTTLAAEHAGCGGLDHRWEDNARAGPGLVCVVLGFFWHVCN